MPAHFASPSAPSRMAPATLIVFAGKSSLVPCRANVLPVMFTATPFSSTIGAMKSTRVSPTTISATASDI